MGKCMRSVGMCMGTGTGIVAVQMHGVVVDSAVEVNETCGCGFGAKEEGREKLWFTYRIGGQWTLALGRCGSACACERRCASPCWLGY
jgi:hypothetical protein